MTLNIKRNYKIIQQYQMNLGFITSRGSVEKKTVQYIQAMR